jgi:hypothetical protein
LPKIDVPSEAEKIAVESSPWVCTTLLATVIFEFLRKSEPPDLSRNHPTAIPFG